jgi:hypothetical protein
MLAKITSKNQLTLPKAAVAEIGAAEYFDVEVRRGQIVLTPVRIQRGDSVRAKLDELGITEGDLADAVRWARSGQSGAGHRVSEPPAEYSLKPAARKPAPRKKAAKKQPPRRP